MARLLVYLNNLSQKFIARIGRIKKKKLSNYRAGSRRNESGMLSLYDAILRSFRKD